MLWNAQGARQSSTGSQNVLDLSKAATRLALAPIDTREASTTSKEKAKEPKKKNGFRPPKKRSQAKLRTHLEEFFAQYEYEGFKYDPAKPYMGEFYRMTNHFDWNSKGTDEQKEKFRAAREGISEASVLQFNAIYGKKKNAAAWRNLCSVLDIAKIPESREGCRELIESVYVNICDLVDSQALNVKVQHFNSEEELSAYTKRTGKYFPLEDAHAGGLLRFLLRKILNPPEGESPRPRPELRK